MHARLLGLTLAALSGAGATLLVLSLVSATQAGDPVRVTELLTRPLPDVPGKEATMIAVDYAPGAADPVHRHDASALLYVLEGKVEMQVRGGEKVTLGPGQTFYEGPSDVHVVGRNASDQQPAKFLVCLVKNQGAPLLIPADR